MFHYDRIVGLPPRRRTRYGPTAMTRLALLLILIAAPAMAADGTYAGEGTFVSGRADSCMGTAWTFEVSGNQIHAKVLPRTGRDRTRFVDGVVNPDGTITMSYTVPYGGTSRTVTIEGKFVSEGFEGVSNSATCTYALKLQRQR